MKGTLRSSVTRQRGFTLIEVLVALVILSAISFAITATLMQVMTRTADNDAHMVAVKQIENAIHHLSRDVQMAQVITPGGGSGLPLTLAWTDWDNVTHTVTYDLADSQLRRTDDGATAVVATGLSTASFERDGAKLAYSLIATARHGASTTSESRSGEIMPRPATQ